MRVSPSPTWWWASCEMYNSLGQCDTIHILHSVLQFIGLFCSLNRCKWAFSRLIKLISIFLKTIDLNEGIIIIVVYCPFSVTLKINVARNDTISFFRSAANRVYLFKRAILVLQWTIARWGSFSDVVVEWRRVSPIGGFLGKTPSSLSFVQSEAVVYLGNGLT